MTRQKASERQTLENLLAALNLRPDAEPVAGETPDFVMMLSGRSIGVEITMYQSGSALERGGNRRQAESEWDKLRVASDEYRRKNGDVQDINAGLLFRGPVPLRRQQAEFIEEIAGFIRTHRAALKPNNTAYSNRHFSAPLMRAYLQTLYLRIDRHAVWHSNLVAGFVARPDATIAQIVAEKSSKKFRVTDETWLAISCSIRISETVSTILGVDDFDAVPPLDEYRFERIFVLAFDGIYEWRRGHKWRQLSGRAAA